MPCLAVLCAAGTTSIRVDFKDKLGQSIRVAKHTDVVLLLRLHICNRKRGVPRLFDLIGTSVTTARSSVFGALPYTGIPVLIASGGRGSSLNENISTAVEH